MKCTHQCDETQGNNSTQALSTKIVFFACKKITENKKKKEESVFILNTVLHQLLVCPLLCFLLLFVVYLLTPEEDIFC